MVSGRAVQFPPGPRGPVASSSDHSFRSQFLLAAAPSGLVCRVGNCFGRGWDFDSGRLQFRRLGSGRFPRCRAHGGGEFPSRWRIAFLVGREGEPAMGRALMIQGTASHAGKSVLTAAFGCWLRRQGLRVAPFKAQNMSLNSFVTLAGEEIARSQAMQAEALGLEPVADMNPILLKPMEHGCQVIIQGHAIGTMSIQEYY